MLNKLQTILDVEVTLPSSQMEPFVLTDVIDIRKKRNSASTKALDRIPTTFRTRQSGPCTATTYWGNRVINFDCAEGFFDILLNKTGPGDASCEKCRHSLLQHASIRRSGSNGR